MTPSYRQQAVYDTFDKTDKNILIEAVAGSGKTTVLLELLRRCKKETLFLAFNKSIKEDIEKQIEKDNIEYATSLTLHSLGLAAIKKYYKGASINKSKNYDLIATLKNRNTQIYNFIANNKYNKDKKKRLNEYKINFTLMSMNDVSRMFLTDDYDEVLRLMVDMDKHVDNFKYLELLWDDLVEVRRDYDEHNSVIDIDFVDMIYLPVIFSMEIPESPKYVFVDEAQDLNQAQHTMIDNLFKQGDVERWVAVGDRRQSIYGFAGAHSESFDLFKEKENTIELPLDICYRCPTNVVEAANQVYNVMTAFKKDEGVVGDVYDPSEIKDNSMVICRNVSPLIELYFRLVNNNKQAYLKGEDILNRMLTFLNNHKFKSVHQMMVDSSMEALVLKSDKENFLNKYKAAKLEENRSCVQIMIEGEFIRRGDKVETLITQLKGLFKKKQDGIMLCSIHKSKGLENDFVYILEENLIPSKFATSPQQLVQEQNLKYVARTRAKKELYYLNLDIPVEGENVGG
jgi:DNA helicase II / ATP-dependent DNA helicase PcrA